MGAHGHGDASHAARRQHRPNRPNAAPIATKETVDRLLRLAAEDAPLDDLLQVANEISMLTESCDVFPVTLDTGDRLVGIAAAEVRRSAEQDQPDGVLRAALDGGRIANISVNSRRQVTFFCKDSSLRTALKGTTVRLNGIVFKFPEGNSLMDTYYFEMAGFLSKFSTRELFEALHDAGIKAIAIYYVSVNPDSKLDPTRIRVHVAAKSAPAELLINGNLIDQVFFQGSYFPVRCRGEGRNTLANAFRERSPHCLVLNAAAVGSSTGRPRGTRTTTPDEEKDGDTDMANEEAAYPPDAPPVDANAPTTFESTAGQADSDHSERLSNADTMSDAEDTTGHKKTLLDLSLSVIDIDPDLAAFSNGASVIDVLETSFSDEDFITMQRRNKRYKPASTVRVDTGAARDDVVSPNRFASLTDFDVEFEVIEWKLTDVAETSPLRVTVKPKATVPVKVSKTAKSYSLPLLAKPSEDEDASVTYSTPTPLAAIASDVREAIRQASNQQLDVQSDSAFFHATEARYALKNYADPSALISEIRSEPLAHAFAFASEIQHDQYAFNSAIRLHTIQRCLAASDDDRVREFMRRAASLLDVAAPFERGTIINKFQAISEQADEDC